MDNVSTNHLLSVFRTEALKIETEKSDGTSDLHYSFQKDAAGETDATPVQPEQLSYFFSNFAAKIIFDMLGNASTDQEVQAFMLFHSHGKPLDWVNQIYPYTFDFFTETGNAGGPIINVHRRVYLERSVTIHPDYHHVMQNSFGATITPITSETGLAGADTKIVLESELSLEGEWVEPFEDAGVQEFTLLDGSVIRTPFMSSKGKHYVQQFQNHKVLSIPFKQDPASRFSILFYLPDSLDDWESLRDFLGIAESVVQDVYFPEEQVQVGEFLIPKFGMTVQGPMSMEYDFDRMVDSSHGLLTTQSSRITSELRIDERGLKARGFTSASFKEKGVEPSPASRIAPSSRILPLPEKKEEKIDFVANRPFLFFIRDNRFGRMLYSGGLTLPFGASYVEEK